MSTIVSYPSHQSSWDSALPGSNFGPEQTVTSNYFPGGLYQPQLQGPLSTNIGATSGTNHGYPANGYSVLNLGQSHDIHHHQSQSQTLTQQQQFSAMASNGGMNEISSGSLQFPPQPMLASQGQGLDGSYGPWNGQMSSLENQAQQQYDQNSVVSYNQSQQYNQNSLESFVQSQQQPWAMPNGLHQATVNLSAALPFDGWEGQIDSLFAGHAQPQQLYHGSSDQPQLVQVGPPSQNFSFYPQQFSQDSHQSSRSSSQASAPAAPPVVEKKRRRKAATKGSSEGVAEKKSKKAAPKNKGKAAAKGSKGVVPSSSTPAPPVSVPSKKRRREADNEELPSQVPTKRARTITPIPRLIPPPAVPMMSDPLCLRSTGAKECTCQGCFNRKAAGDAHKRDVGRYISDLCLQGLSITKEILAGAEILIPIDANKRFFARHVWSLDTLIKPIGSFEAFFHHFHCFVIDMTTGYKYWWPNHNLTEPSAWPAHFAAIPCPPELVRYWSVLYIAWAYAGGNDVSVSAVVAHLEQLGNIPANIPSYLHFPREMPVIDPGLVPAQDTVGSYNGANGPIDQFNFTAIDQFDVPAMAPEVVGNTELGSFVNTFIDQSTSALVAPQLPVESPFDHGIDLAMVASLAGVGIDVADVASWTSEERDNFFAFVTMAPAEVSSSL